MKRLVKVNCPIGGKNAGDKFELEFDGDTPVDKFWRRRFNDSKIDNCIEIVKKKEAKK